jgi:uncharacterized protein YfiM (DUF2279 family)
MMITRLVACLALCGFGTPVAAQNQMQVFRGSLVAAESVTGRVLLLPDTLVFLDEEKPEASFFAHRAAIQTVNADNDSATFQLTREVKDRAGATTRLIFRLSSSAEAAALQNWFASSAAANAGPAGGVSTDVQVLTFSAQRKKRMRGNTHGKLIVDDQRLMFESTDNALDSRRWDLRDIKELKQRNPYELEVRPFRGERYTLMLSGAGMDNAQYKEIVDRVTKSRIAR